MPRLTPILSQFLVLLVAIAASLVMDVTTAYAQTDTCARLANTLKTLERNSNFQSADGNKSNSRNMQRDLQRLESSYVREGCNDDAKAGRKLNSQCRSLANKILDGREQLKQLNQQVDTGEAVGQQREAILQEMARFDCDNMSSAQVVRKDRGNFFEQLFGRLSGSDDGEGGVREEEFEPYGGYHTVRTLCVRKSDGFYWPISYSTLVDYVGNDADQCRTQCPGLDVDLYYYDNPGQEAEQMINTFGEPYTALPNAFRFRTDFDTSAKCNPVQDMGQISVADLGDGISRALVTFRGATFPLPLRDPRGSQQRIITAPLTAEIDNSTYVDVPLPRRRPSATGEASAAAPVPVATPTAPADAGRVVMFGGKRVRIVGPETPYAKLAEAGT
jgi:hypothetical protein